MSVNTKINGQLVKSAGLYKNIVPIGLGDCYSTEERQVGVWTDGKPLYQKTIDFPSVAKGTNTISHNIANIDQPIHVQWYFYFTTNKNILVGHEDNGVGYWAQVYFFTPTSVSYKLGTQWSNIGGLKATFYYTKTTDTAGSGIYVPSGDYAVHYSTDEQVIGTWIDGSTIYRKVIEFGALPNASSKTVDHNITGLKEVINFRMFAHDTSYANYLPINFNATSSQNIPYQTSCYITSSKIRVDTGSNRSGYSGYAILEYTKTA